MILVCGDTHGDIDFRKLSNKKLLQKFGDLPNYLLVAGDFGLPWSNDPNNAQDLYLKRWYEAKPYYVIVTPGNHDNYDRIYNMPKEVFHGANIRKYSDNIFFLEKGEVITLEDKTFFSFGGAESIDKLYRREGVSWWSQEDATYADFMKVDVLLQGVKSVDYVITHTAPEFVINEIAPSRRDSTSQLLTYIAEHLAFKTWYFGHMHVDKAIVKDGRSYVCLYNDVATIV